MVVRLTEVFVPMNNDRIKSYLDHIYDLDYKERPVSMKTFLNSPQFLGKITSGGKNVKPVWKEPLNNIEREDSKYVVVLTGAIGTGKTTTAIEGIAYVMHRILCLKDPWKYFKKMSGGKMAIVFFNLTKSLGESKGFNLLQSYLLSSPWFLEHGSVCGSEKNPRIEFPIFEYKLASPQAQGFGFIGEHVIAGIMDEVDSPIASEPQKRKIIAAYDATIRRFESRFVLDGQSIGRLFLVSSKQERMSFLNAFIIKMKSSKKVYVVDVSIWDANDASDYSGEKFRISLGDQFTPPAILESADELKEVIEKGFEVIDVPVEYKDEFERDMVGSLRDLAGRSISQLRVMKLFASESVLNSCYDKTRSNPILVETIEVGLKDDVDLLNYIDISKIRIARNIPRYIHVDIAFTGDAMGIGMSCVSGWMRINSRRPDGTFVDVKKPVAETDLAIRIKARQGDQIPIHKVHQLILDLKNVCKFNIAMCTFDLRIASITSMQTLELAGIQCESLSLDKSPQMYRGFREVVNERRWVCFRDSLLHFELSNLEDDPVKNKIDHPDFVTDIKLNGDGTTEDIALVGSKDKADGVTGSVMKALECCNTPPDTEVMQKMFDQVRSCGNTITDITETITDVRHTTVKKSNIIPDIDKSKDMYKDILKRCL